MVPNIIARLDIFPITPATTGLLKYKTEAVKIAIAIISIPITNPTIPIILSKLSINMNILLVKVSHNTKFSIDFHFFYKYVIQESNNLLWGMWEY